MPKVSVIIPNYNHARFLKQRIESILNQSFQDYELILLDDKSSDYSIDILNNYRNHPKVKNIILNLENSGSTFKQWKKGIDCALGEWIWFAESDDYADINFLTKLLNYTEPEVGLIFCNSFNVDENSNLMGQILTIRNGSDFELETNDFFISEGVKFIQSHLIYENCIPNASAVLMRKDLLIKIDIDGLKMKVGGDWWIYCSLLKYCKVCGVFQPLNYYRSHQGTVRSKRKYLVSGIYEMIEILHLCLNILEINIEQLPRKKNYFLSYWYVESLTHTKFLSANFFSLLKLFNKIFKISNGIIIQIIHKYVFLLKVFVKSFISQFSWFSKRPSSF